MTENHDSELALKWLNKAKNDIITAQHIISIEEPMPDIICFHCQQGIEKSLKALLTSHSISFPKTHNLITLLELCLPIFPILTKYENQFAEMTTFAVEIRYPEDVEDSDIEKVKEFVDIAVEVHLKISNIIFENSLF